MHLFNQFVGWVSGAWWSYPVVFLVSMLDAFFPFVPSETVVITAGVLASSGDLSLPLVIVCAILGRSPATTSPTVSARGSASEGSSGCSAAPRAGAPSNGPSASSRCEAST